MIKFSNTAIRLFFFKNLWTAKEIFFNSDMVHCWKKTGENSLYFLRVYGFVRCQVSETVYFLREYGNVISQVSETVYIF
jgi:hypothetical protein